MPQNGPTLSKRQTDEERRMVVLGGSPQSMSPAQIVAEIRRLYEGMENASRRIQELSQSLVMRSRRTTHEARQATGKNLGFTDELTARAHGTWGQAWFRLSGVVIQAIRRTVSADRTLDTSRAAQEAKDRQEAEDRERVLREERKEARRQRYAESVGTGPAGVSDLIELYGRETIHAGR